jgi:GntR family transcriptional regulator
VNQSKRPTPAALAARRLRDMLRGEILTGAFHGAPLPSEGELMRRYGASRGVVRKALAMLRDEDLIRRLQGQGTFAVAPAVITRLVEVHGCAEPEPGTFLGGHPSVRPDILTWASMRAPEAVKRHLGPDSDEVLCIDYVHYVEGQPLAAATNYVAYPEAAKLEPALFNTDWYQLLIAAGIAVAASSFVIGCEAAPPEIASLLGLSPGHPLMTLEQTIRGEDGRIFDVAYIHARGDRFGVLSHAVAQRAGDLTDTTADMTALRRHFRPHPTGLSSRHGRFQARDGS